MLCEELTLTQNSYRAVLFYFFHKLKENLLKIGFTLSHKCQPKPINAVICLEADEGIKAAVERK